MTARIITTQFEAPIYSERHGDDFDANCEVTGAIELRDETYDIRLQTIRIGIESYRPAMVSARVAQCAEMALVAAYEAAEASERRNAKQVEDIVNAARAHAAVLS